jgi:trehalose-phosphatase
VFLDYDGTLTPIVARPRDAWMSDAMRSIVRELARHCPVAIVSGRDREDVEARAGIEGIFYAGNHGFDIAGRGYKKTLPEAEEALDEVERAEDELNQRVGRLSGVIVERKRYSVAAHYRQVDSESVVKQVERAVDSIREKTGLRKRTGKKVFELEPAVDWDKGRALQWLIDVLPTGHHETSFVIYVGDDETDEDAFAALAGAGAGIRVDNEITTSLADYHLEDPGEVGRLLQLLTASLEGKPGNRDRHEGEGHG